METSLLDRVPPQSVEAEMAVLGSCIVDPPAADRAREGLDPSDFYREAHQVIFEGVARLRAQGIPADLTNLSNELQRVGQFELAGGRSYLMDCIESVPTAASIAHYAQIVRETADLRRLIRIGSDLIAQGYSRETSPREILERAQREILRLGKELGFSQRRSSLYEAMGMAIEGAREAMENADRKLIYSGIRAFDEAVQGFEPGELVILAAETSGGKSALAQQIGMHNSARGYTVHYSSLEMNRRDHGRRALSYFTRIPSWRIKTGQLSAAEIAQLEAEQKKVDGWPLHFTENCLKLDQIEQEIREFYGQLPQHQRERVLFIIDHLHTISVPTMRNRGRVEQMEEVTKAVKGLAQSLQVPILGCAQFARDPQAKNKRRPPVLADLKWSSEIEQLASVVALMWWDKPTGMEQAPDIVPAYVRIDKNRNGNTWAFHLRWNRPAYRFEDPDEANAQMAERVFG